MIDLLGRLRGGLDPKRRADLLERFDLDPTKKGRTYSKGNRQKVALVAALAVRRRAADPRRADLRAGPADGGGVPGLHRARNASAAARCCCPATSSPRSRRSATGSASSAPGRTVETGTLAELRHLTRTSIAAELAAPPNGLADLAGRARPAGRRQPGAVRRRHRTSSTASLRQLTDVGVRSLTSQPPTLEELFLRHYEADRRRDRPARGGGEMTATALARAGPRRRRRAGADRFAGTGALLRLALRRDRVIATVWILLFVVMAAGSASASQSLFTDAASRRVRAAAAVNDTPATLALYGRVFDPTSLGAVSLFKLGAMGAALVGAGRDLHGGAAHPRRGGGRPAGAARRDRGRPVRRADRGAAAGRRHAPSCWRC